MKLLFKKRENRVYLFIDRSGRVVSINAKSIKQAIKRSKYLATKYPPFKLTKRMS